MGKNPLDHDHLSDSGMRTAQYVQIERSGLSQAGNRKIKMLDRRRKGRADLSRLKQYMRIDRGLMA